MTPCTWLTSLDKASIARESSWRWGSVTLSVLAQQRVDCGELRIHALAEVGVALVEDRPHRGNRGLRAVDVGLEVPEVGVAEDVFLAADLACRDLVEQTLCATGDLGGVDGPVGGLHSGG